MREGKVPGDQHSASPLDDSLFSSFKRERGEHIAATFDLPKGDPAKFSMATPKLGESCFLRCWDVLTAEEVQSHIDRWPANIQAIVDNKGMLVEKSKARGHRQQRGYLGKMHPDAEKAMAASEAKFGGQ